MSKILPASCSAGVVTIEGLPVPDVTILSEGAGGSSGVALMEEDQVTYVAKTSPDLATALDKIATALTQIATALTAIDVKPFGSPGTTAPVAAASITQITTLQAQLVTLKGALR